MTNMESPVWTKNYCIPSKTEAGHAVLDGVLQQLEEFSWDKKDVFAIHLALEEALVNAIRHGNQSNNRLCVQVHFEISPQKFLVTIRDEGSGFDPNSIPDPTLEDFLERPCGRGVKLMRSFMTTVSFNEAGNEVTLIKEHTAPIASTSISESVFPEDSSESSSLSALKEEAGFSGCDDEEGNLGE